MDLISYYTRLVATLHPILRDIAPQLVEMLIKDFKFQVFLTLYPYMEVLSVNMFAKGSRHHIVVIFPGIQEGPDSHSV